MRPSLLVLAIAALGSGAGQAEEAGTPAALTCQVSGYDVILINGGAETIAEGTEIEWSVPFARQEGVHILDRDLEPEAMVFLSGALGSSFLESSTPCEIGPSEGEEGAEAAAGEG